MKALNKTNFRADLHKMMNLDVTTNVTSVDNLVDIYNNNIQQVFDRHAPAVTRKVQDRPSAPWLTDEVRQSRRLRRRAERKWRTSQLVIHRQIFAEARHSTSLCIQEAKRKYYQDKINSDATSKQLFTTRSELLGKRVGKVLPSNVPRPELPQTFCDYFSNKIKIIREGLDSRNSDPPTFASYDGPLFTHFRPVTEKDILDVIRTSASKSCDLDPLPTTLLKESLPDLVPMITNIVNCSLYSGVVPDKFKIALVTPLLKKLGLDCNVLKNYRPVSNLPFISKILEKMVLKQLQSHLSSNNLLEIHQSAYRKDHSTETAVLSVIDGLLKKADQKLISVTALLDLSAAFDTLDHTILLKRLEVTFGVRGTVLQWFSSYVSDRYQSVNIDGNTSAPSLLLFGVPQGSVLGPVLFTLYSQPLSDILSDHNCDYHKYADDTKLSKSFPPNQIKSAQLSVERCISDVLSWMNSNKLMLNADKTEVMPAGIKSILNTISVDSINIVGNRIPYKPSVKYLGVKIDQSLSMHDQISSICRTAFMELRRIAIIRSYLSIDACTKLVLALITSRLDYCNSILAGLPDDQLRRLQMVQNCAARLIMRKRKRDHVTPLLVSLHWLPIKSRIDYKLAVFAYRHFDGSLPPYLSNVLKTYHPTRPLRSSYEKILVSPRFNRKTVGERSFSFSAPSVWNSLPVDIRNIPTLSAFKSNLKTLLFKKSFL